MLISKKQLVFLLRLCPPRLLKVKGYLFNGAIVP